MDLSETDPGRRYRRRARLGAIICVIATVLPFDNSVLWAEVINIFRVATNQMPQMGSPRVLVVIFCCLAVPTMLSGFFGIVIFTPAALVKGRVWTVPNVAAALFLLLTLLPAFCFSLIQLSYLSGGSETIVAIGLSVLLVYLFAGGITFLNSWHHRGTPLFIFWCLSIPLTATLLAWLCLLIHLFSNYFLVSALIAICLGFLGSLLLFTGWLGWWSAVKAALASPSSEMDVKEPDTVSTP